MIMIRQFTPFLLNHKRSDRNTLFKIDILKKQNTYAFKNL